MRPDPAFPVQSAPIGPDAIDLADLSYGQHLIVWAFRAFAKGRDCVIVRREFDHGCGERATEAFNAMRIFVQQLAAQGRRLIPLAPPGSPTLADDERTVLDLFAAAQTGDTLRFARHFRALTAMAYDPLAERAVRLVAEALRLRGHRLAAIGEAEPWVETSRLSA